MLALVLLPAPVLAAGDDDVDTGGVSEDDDTVYASGIAKSADGAWGGLKLEGLVLWRKDLPSFSFTKLTGGGTAFEPFDTSDLSGGEYSSGMRASLQATIFDQPFELSAFYVFPMDVAAAKGDLVDTDAIYHEAPGFDFSSANSEDMVYFDVRHETRIYGAEANLLQQFGIPGLLIGARAINFSEQLTSMTARQADDVPGAADNDRDHVSVRTDNRLIGLQAGIDHMFDLGGGLRIGGSAKAGLYKNFVDRNRSFESENVINTRSFERTDHDDVYSRGFELNPRVELKIAEGTYLTAAGQFLWLDNVSTAIPNYTSVTDLDDHNVRATDDVYFYGGSLGLTIALDQSSPVSNSLAPFAVNASGFEDGPVTIDDVEERIAELEDRTARKGNDRVSLSISGWINRMVMAWDDGDNKDVYVVDNTASRSRINFTGGARIARGWSAGYILSLGFDNASANDVNQFITDDDEGIQVRHSAWWIRSSLFGMATVGHTSTATDNIILKDVGGIMPGAANIATIGGSFLLRHADRGEQGEGDLVTNASGTVSTTLNDFSAGASVDTLRRDVIRYDAPRFSGLWGNVDLAAAWGEDDFYDLAIEHGINYNDFKFRLGAGYLHDTTEARVGRGNRNREEYKGSASLLHIPTGLFATAAYVRRTFHGQEDFTSPGTPQATFGENTAGKVTPPGTNRPPIDYLYTAAGIRRQYWSIGDTSVYGEYAQVSDAVTGLREVDLNEVTDSSLMMVGAAICQDIDSAGIDLYAGVRVFSFDAEGYRGRTSRSVTTYYLTPVPISDLMIGYAGTRIKF